MRQETIFLGQDRMHFGQGHEDAVLQKLTQYGWKVQKWGQGLFDDEIRVALTHRVPTVYWRWIPDLIAVRGNHAILVDPKFNLRDDTPNFSIETDAHQAHKMMLGLGLPIVYVFKDMTCNTPEGLQEVAAFPRQRFGATRGSGTAYILIRKDAQRPFDWAFGNHPFGETQ